jgi:Rha family phage regulatory protein
MENLVEISKQIKDQLTTTSFKVAQAFDKDHRKVMRDIEQLISSGHLGGVAKFAHTPYIHPQNQQTYYYYEMNQDAFTILVMGYTGDRALEFKVKFLNAFNNMKQLLTSKEYILSRAFEILKEEIGEKEATIKQLEETTKTQETIIKEQAPGVQYFKEVLQAKNAWTITTIAKELDMTANKLNKILCDLSIQFKRDDHYVLHSKYNGNGYTKTKTHTYINHLGETNTNIQTTWTESGRNFIHNLIKKFNGQGVARIAQQG